MRDYIGEILSFLGPTGVIIPLGLPGTNWNGQAIGENPAGTTVTAVHGGSGLNAVFTYSEARKLFDAPTYYRGRGRVPHVPLNGVDEEADTPDDPYFTRALLPFSLGLWYRPTTLPLQSNLFSKADWTPGAEAREWSTFITSTGNTQFLVIDETANAWIGRQNTTAPQIKDGFWYFLVFTYDGGTLASGMKIYRDYGMQIDDADQSSGVFTTMRDTATLPQFGFQIGTGGTAAQYALGTFRGGSIGPFVTQIELTADQIKRLFLIGLDAQKNLSPDVRRLARR